jgi:hypothetical protein
VNHRADGPASGRSRLAHLVLHSFGGAEAPRRRRPMRMDRTRTATAADAFLESRHTTHPPTSPGPVATRQDTDTCKSTRSFPRHRSFCCVHRRSLQRECRSFGTIEKIRMVGCALPAAILHVRIDGGPLQHTSQNFSNLHNLPENSLHQKSRVLNTIDTPPVPQYKFKRF